MTGIFCSQIPTKFVNHVETVVTSLIPTDWPACRRALGILHYMTLTTSSAMPFPWILISRPYWYRWSNRTTCSPIRSDTFGFKSTAIRELKRSGKTWSNPRHSRCDMKFEKKEGQAFCRTEKKVLLDLSTLFQTL